ncbi:S1 domain-containing RNA-binding protein [Enterococcus sp. LJL128]|uniref:S1 domain-containing RNA-binding protein n=1 Tax=Enterococcus sp. LJL51 TaxID=3416656 RepID=UPI003CEE86CD
MSIEVGAKLPGKVSGITNFGAFIDLGEGKTGLVHISEVSNGFVKDINDILTVGDEVTVKVTSVGDDGKIGLSIRKAQENAEAPKSNFQRRNHQENQDRGHHSAPKKQFNKPMNNNNFNNNSKQDFDTLMSSFLKDSDDRLSSLRRNTEGKRGGRGGRRN